MFLPDQLYSWQALLILMHFFLTTTTARAIPYILPAPFPFFSP